MKLRDFFKVLPLVPFGAKALSHEKTLVPPVKEWPDGDPDHVIGLWVQGFNYDTKRWDCPHLILREYDDRYDVWMGQQLYNPRRNKFWGKPMTGGPEVLLCFDRWDHNIRFFKNTPNTDWSLICPP